MDVMYLSDWSLGCENWFYSIGVFWWNEKKKKKKKKKEKKKKSVIAFR